MMTNGKSKEQELADIIAKHAAEMIIKEVDYANIINAVIVLRNYCQMQEDCNKCTLDKIICSVGNYNVCPEDWEVE